MVWLTGFNKASLQETTSLLRPINPWQRLCRGRPSAKSSRGILSRRRGSLPRALYRALGKAFAEGWSGTRQRKAAVTAPAPGTESLPRAVSGGPRQRIILFFWKIFAEGLQPWLSAKKFAEFFQKIFAEGNRTALGKELFFFFEKSLSRASPQALGKEILIFLKKVFAEGLRPWPSAKKCSKIFPMNLCRGQWDGPRQRIILFFKKKSLPRVSPQALGKEILIFLKKIFA